MNAELATLYKVQETDSEIARHERALGLLDSGAELQEEIRGVEGELAGLRGELAAAEKENLDSELELKTLEEKRGRFQGQLYSGTVSNPRQLSDLHKEVEMLGREVRKIEDRLLGLMEVMEQRRTAIGEREGRLGELQEELGRVQAAYEEKGGRLRTEIGTLTEQRKEYAGQVNAHLLKRYEQIRARGGGVGLVKVTGTMCPGCRITLPSETVKAAKAGRSGLTCDNCGRLLLWDGGERAEAEEGEEA